MKMGELTGKVAVVTGASKGIGAGIAKRFGAAGASVVVNYASNREGADKVVAEIKKEGGKAIAVKADVSKAGEVKQLFEETKRAFGKLDVLVNNAGVFRFAPLQDVTEEEFHREFNINVLGTLLATKEALNHFNGSGSVINLSSVVSTSPIPNSSVYSASRREGRDRFDRETQELGNKRRVAALDRLSRQVPIGGTKVSMIALVG
jgi:3-oxoacyl-[acyl-carrier protein] reductase